MALDLEILKRIAPLPTAPLIEDLVRKESVVILNELFDDESSVSVRVDPNDNVIAHYKGDPNRKSPRSIAYVAHMDHPAFHVDTNISVDSYIIKMMGGLNPDLMIDSRVSLHRRTESGRLITARGKIVKVVDPAEGNPSHRYVANVTNGTEEFGYEFATLDLPQFEIGGDRIIRAPVLDDYASIGMSIGALRQIVSRKMPVDVYVVLHRAEEIGFVGAYTVASSNALPSDCMVYSIETSSYLAQRDRNNKDRVPQKIAEVGGGIILRTGDAMTPTYDYAALRLAAQASLYLNSHKVQELRMYGGSCEADLYFAMGYRTAGMCIPLIAWHNNGALEGKKVVMPEGVHLDDFHAGTELMVKTAETLTERPELFRSLKSGDITPQHEQLVAKVKGLSEKYLGKTLD